MAGGTCSALACIRTKESYSLLSRSLLFSGEEIEKHMLSGVRTPMLSCAPVLPAADGSTLAAFWIWRRQCFREITGTAENPLRTYAGVLPVVAVIWSMAAPGNCGKSDGFFGAYAPQKKEEHEKNTLMRCFIHVEADKKHRLP